ncbi:hypothetical protein N0V93_004792 [Gnomoniopsis smithogilvyi]|uniref:SMODS and SLOG-associating 2TM effector domain-containing protein n=1 Tax=Gnomoniopsis smithogilvyi TaxID=1191159 RepID=A0A9W9CXI2_9PEZI|nr:hypothetical protein N0V93_004792 [Gnomoniopsis smithogilvyi]
MPSWKMFGSGPSDTTPLLSDVASDDSALNSPSSSSNSPLSPGTIQDNIDKAVEMRRGLNDGPAWSDPLGRPARDENDEHLRMFRRAVGITTELDHTFDHGPHGSIGIYQSIVEQERRKRIMHHTLSGMVWGCHGIQIVLGATLTCLGLSTNEYPITVTILGAVNTVTASFLTLVKGKGITEKLGKTEADFRTLKVWIEETESLLALGIIGGDRKEVGLLIETAFRRYNAAFGRSFDIETGIDRDVDNLSTMDAERSGPDHE